MAGAADAQNLEVDAAQIYDRLLERAAVRIDLIPREIATGDVHVLASDIDVIE